MAIRVVQLGVPRPPGESLRLGAARRPPRGVPKSEYASRDFYDVWLPELAPSEELVRVALRARDQRNWQRFVKRHGAEMKRPAAARLLRSGFITSFPLRPVSVGCGGVRRPVRRPTWPPATLPRRPGLLPGLAPQILGLATKGGYETASSLLAASSRPAAFPAGCCCADEARCRRSILKALLAERGARVE